MSENITMTVHLSGGASGVQTFNIDNDRTPPLPPQDEEDMNLSFYTDDPAPPPEADDNNEADMSAMAVQAESTNAPPPNYDVEAADTDSSDADTDGPMPPAEA